MPRSDFEELEPGTYCAELTKIKEFNATYKKDNYQKDYRAKRFVFKVQGRNAWANMAVPDSNSKHGRRLKLLESMGELPKSIAWKSFKPKNSDKAFEIPDGAQSESKLKIFEQELIGQYFTIEVEKKGKWTNIISVKPNPERANPQGQQVIDAVMDAAADKKKKLVEEQEKTYSADELFNDDDIPF